MVKMDLYHHEVNSIHIKELREIGKKKDQTMVRNDVYVKGEEWIDFRFRLSYS